MSRELSAAVGAYMEAMGRLWRRDAQIYRMEAMILPGYDFAHVVTDQHNLCAIAYVYDEHAAEIDGRFPVWGADDPVVSVAS